MNELEGQNAKHRALKLIEQAKCLLEQAADEVRPIRSFGLPTEELDQVCSNVKALWDRLDRTEIIREPDHRIPADVAGFTEALAAISAGDTDSVLIFSHYQDWKDTNDGTRVGYQVDPDRDPIDELNQAVAEARAFLGVDETQPIGIELD